jgi:CoA:oxalate CoA-transferase
VRGIDEVVNDPHLHERGMLFNVDHPDMGTIALPSSPIRLGNLPPLQRPTISALGADGDDVIAEWIG